MTNERDLFDVPALSSDLLDRATRHRQAEGQGINWFSPQQSVKNRLSLRRAHEHMTRLQDVLPPAGGRVLELGSGYGMLVYAARTEADVAAFGLEPEPTAIAIANDVLDELRVPVHPFVQGVGESIPFPDNSFDLIYSFNVFEHVADPSRVLAEALRVLKPGGHLYFSFPSYGTWWEGHYGVLWFPGMPKWAAKIYVRLLGRQPDFIDTLQFFTYGRLQRVLSPVRPQVDVLVPDFGQALWEERLRSVAFSEWAQLSRLKSWVRLLHRLRLVNLVILLGRWLHWETPFLLVLRKRAE